MPHYPTMKERHNGFLFAERSRLFVGVLFDSSRYHRHHRHRPAETVIIQAHCCQPFNVIDHTRRRTGRNRAATICTETEYGVILKQY